MSEPTGRDKIIQRAVEADDTYASGVAAMLSGTPTDENAARKRESEVLLDECRRLRALVGELTQKLNAAQATIRGLEEETARLKACFDGQEPMMRDLAIQVQSERQRAEQAEADVEGLRLVLARVGEEHGVVWLVERTIDGRPHWLMWRGHPRCEWTTEAAQADRFDWAIAAAHEARLVQRSQGIACQATEHMFLPGAPDGA